jgi:Uri superfamily endonuclease
MDLPEDKGTYILIAQVVRMRRLHIGSLGEFDLVRGFYAYVGSAFGSGGLRARLGHHLESTAEPHWHIDYLLQAATPIEVWYTTANSKLEHHWADLMEDVPGFLCAFPALAHQIIIGAGSATFSIPSGGLRSGGLNSRSCRPLKA